MRIILDKVYMIVHPTEGVLYSGPAPTAKEAWEKAETQLGITGGDKAYWTRRGFRACRVEISTVTEKDVRGRGQSVRVEGNQYTCDFLRYSRGKWRKFWFCGNTGVALSVVELLRKLRHPVATDVRDDEE